ncbi:MAG TPA: hypothetical protein VL860_06780, partial [Planctomycetota bacterium]|nr:hypothetical protein [Planctomycetota bacterium]
PAGVDEIIGGVKDWLDKNPSYRGNNELLGKFMRGEGWKKGPAVLAGSKFYSTNGWLPAATHGWYTTMMEYDGNPRYEYEYGYSQGYRVNVALRDGEVLTRNWSNQGLHVNMNEQKEFELLTYKIGADDLKYAPQYGDLAPGRIGNGSLVYTVPVASAALKDAALTYDNLVAAGETKQVPALRTAQPGKPGVLVLRMPSSYVYLGGTLTGKATVGNGGSVKILFSRNNGADWKEIFAKTDAGDVDLNVDLKPSIFRTYDYRLKFELTGAGTGLNALKIDQTIQNSQRSLPALDQGKNTITFSAGNPGPVAAAGAAAGAPPQFEGTITVEAGAQQAPQGGQIGTADFHPALQNLQANGYGSQVQGGSGSITFPIETPGPITHVRFGCHYRAMDARDKWELQVSFDAGKSWTTAGTCEGGVKGSCKYVTFDTPPKGAKQVQVRYLGTQVSESILFSYCINVDYVEPHAGFRPVQVTYVYDEDGKEKRNVHVAKSAQETYTIECATKPVLKSLIVELAK